MLELIGIYIWTLLAAAISAPLLSTLGIHLATRDRSAQTLCLGQGALVGVLLGIGLFHDLEGSYMGAVAPFLMGLFISSFTYWVTEHLGGYAGASKNSLFAAILAFLMSVGYLIGNLFPALESHMAQVYFGDLATLSAVDSKVATVVSALCFLWILRYRQAIGCLSFEMALFGDSYARLHHRSVQWLFRILSLIVLSFSVQFLGFLFTVSMLFVPTSILRFSKVGGLKFHFAICMAIALCSSLSGFIISLKFTHLPTVPTISVTVFLLSLLMLVLCELARRGSAAIEAGKKEKHELY